MRTRGVLDAILVAGAAVAIVALVVYALSAPRSGTVEDAWLTPAHSERYQSGSVCYSYDKNHNCTLSMPVYSTRWVPDACYVKINDAEKSHREATWAIGCDQLAAFQAKRGQWVDLG